MWFVDKRKVFLRKNRLQSRSKSYNDYYYADDHLIEPHLSRRVDTSHEYSCNILRVQSNHAFGMHGEPEETWQSLLLWNDDDSQSAHLHSVVLYEFFFNIHIFDFTLCLLGYGQHLTQSQRKWKKDIPMYCQNTFSPNRLPLWWLITSDSYIMNAVLYVYLQYIKCEWGGFFDFTWHEKLGWNW